MIEYDKSSAIAVELQRHSDQLRKQIDKKNATPR